LDIPIANVRTPDTCGIGYGPLSGDRTAAVEFPVARVLAASIQLAKARTSDQKGSAQQGSCRSCSAAVLGSTTAAPTTAASTAAAQWPRHARPEPSNVLNQPSADEFNAVALPTRYPTAVAVEYRH